MLSADTALKVRPLRTTSLDSELNQLANTLGVDGLEWISIENLVAKLFSHEGADIITRETEGHLCEVVGTE